MSSLSCDLRFSIFVLETLKFEWQCSQYLDLNPTCGCKTKFYVADGNVQERHSTFYFRYETSAAVFLASWVVKALTDGNVNTSGNIRSPVFDHLMLLLPINSRFHWWIQDFSDWRGRQHIILLIMEGFAPWSRKAS